MSTRLVAMALASAVLAGCTTPPARLQPIKVPVPVQCQAQVPARPAMPTEALRPGVGLDPFVKAAQAEIERREGYEERLRAALAECVMPVVPTTGYLAVPNKTPNKQ